MADNVLRLIDTRTPGSKLKSGKSTQQVQENKWADAAQRMAPVYEESLRDRTELTASSFAVGEYNPSFLDDEGAEE